ncbi:TonB-dependent receptor [Hellea sp.]|nr:TonB-dependent receptor [Hellea sp.]
MIIRTSQKLLATAAGAALMTSPAFAQDSEFEDEIIVTGVASPTTVFESTASVTAITPEEISNLAPRSINELFRSIPGIKSEDTGGDANANIKVRGLPIASGGARYLSLQENGIPTLLVGDVAFSTADSYLRADSTIGSVQAIRGGSAATQAPNAAGGIINLISKKPTENGGSVAGTVGIDYDSFRVDAEYGGVLDNDIYYHVGGFARTGEGVRDTVGNFEEGYQIKATVGKDFERGNVAVHFKHLDDRVPTFLPLPAIVQNDGSIGALNGLDLGDGTTSLGIVDTAVRFEDGNQTLDTNSEGVQANFTSIGIEGEYDITDQFTVAAKGRWADIDGNFFAPFPAGLDASSQNADGTFAGGPANINFVLFDTQVTDVGNLFGDISVKGDFDFFKVKAGVFYGNQQSEQSWNFNDARATLVNGEFVTDDPNNLFVNPADGSFINGQAFGNSNFGNCCSVYWDFEIEQIAPYLAGEFDVGNLTVDGSVRFENNNVTGDFISFGNAIVGPFDANGDGMIGTNEQGAQQFNPDALVETDYDADHTAFSIGGNYQVNDNLAVFGNYSEGASLTAPDRSTGNLVVTNGVGVSPDDDLFLNFVDQFEVGLRFKTGIGNWSVVYFDAQVAEAAQFEVTTQETLQNEFDTNGVEVEADFALENGFGLRGNVTITDSELTNTVNAGNTSRRQAPYTANINPYYMGENYDVGLNIFSTGDAPVQDDNAFDLPSYTTVGAYVNYEVYDGLTMSLNANNLLDEQGFTEGEEGAPSIGEFIRFRPINGRTISATVRYDF